MSVKILLARSAGFCFGVSKAVDSVNRLLDEGKTEMCIRDSLKPLLKVADAENAGN